jgi:hypothetical protein
VRDPPRLAQAPIASISLLIGGPATAGIDIL